MHPGNSPPGGDPARAAPADRPPIGELLAWVEDEPRRMAEAEERRRAELDRIRAVADVWDELARHSFHELYHFDQVRRSQVHVLVRLGRALRKHGYADAVGRLDDGNDPDRRIAVHLLRLAVAGRRAELLEWYTTSIGAPAAASAVCYLRRELRNEVLEISVGAPPVRSEPHPVGEPTIHSHRQDALPAGADPARADDRPVPRPDDAGTVRIGSGRAAKGWRRFRLDVTSRSVFLDGQKIGARLHPDDFLFVQEVTKKRGEFLSLAKLPRDHRLRSIKIGRICERLKNEHPLVHGLLEVRRGAGTRLTLPA